MMLTNPVRNSLKKCAVKYCKRFEERAAMRKVHGRVWIHRQRVNREPCHAKYGEDWNRNGRWSCESARSSVDRARCGVIPGTSAGLGAWRIEQDASYRSAAGGAAA